MTAEKKLTPKQEQFCREYIVDLNGAQAAIRAGYSEATAKEIASENLTKLNVQRRISELQKKRQDRTEITADRVLKEIYRIATADLGEAYDEQGHLKPVHEIPEDVRRAIAGIKVFDEYEGFGQDRVKVGEVREVKFWDKNKALDSLGRHLKLFTDKVELSGNVGLAERLAKARKSKGEA